MTRRLSQTWVLFTMVPEFVTTLQILPTNTTERSQLKFGSSSQSFPKKSYGFETRTNSGNVDLDVSLFGMSREHDWVLSANYTDKSFCRNVLTYQLSREMGHYAARTKYVDVVLNGTHMGIYVFYGKN